jgi:hypothetical protein
MKITRRQLREIISEAHSAAYDVAEYLPGLKKVLSPLKGYANEIKSVSWGEDTEMIHREISDAISSLNLVVAALEEAQIEYKRGPMGGELSARSKTMNPKTGEYLETERVDK